MLNYSFIFNIKTFDFGNILKRCKHIEIVIFIFPTFLPNFLFSSEIIFKTILFFFFGLIFLGFVFERIKLINR